MISDANLGSSFGAPAPFQGSSFRLNPGEGRPSRAALAGTVPLHPGVGFP